MVSEEMVSRVDVFVSSVILWVLGQFYNTLAVAFYRCWYCFFCTVLSDESSELTASFVASVESEHVPPDVERLVSQSPA